MIYYAGILENRGTDEYIKFLSNDHFVYSHQNLKLYLPSHNSRLLHVPRNRSHVQNNESKRNTLQTFN